MKLGAITAASLLTLSLTACGGATENKTASSPTTAQGATSTAAPAEAETTLPAGAKITTYNDGYKAGCQVADKNGMTIHFDKMPPGTLRVTIEDETNDLIFAEGQPAHWKNPGEQWNLAVNEAGTDPHGALKKLKTYDKLGKRTKIECAFTPDNGGDTIKNY